MSSLAALVFIAVAAATGIYVGTRPTVIRGDVMAKTMLEKAGAKGVTKIECDPHIPVGVTGAVFACTVVKDDGSTERVQCTMDRAGALAARLLDSTAPSRRPERDPGADPWEP